MFSYICLDCKKEIEIKNKPKKSRFTQVCRICTNKKIALKNIAVTEDLQKLCRKCNILKPATTEHFLKNKKGFLYSYCRECKKNYLKEITPRKNKISLTKEELYEKNLSRQKVSRVENWARHLVNSSRHNAKRYGKEFDIDEEYILDIYEKQNHKCYWFGVELEPSAIHKYPAKPSLDRLNPDIGYIKGNVVISCMAANIGRNSCEADIFQNFCNLLRK
jgi:transposase-like protein